MAYSYIYYNGNGALTTFAIPFSTISDAHVKVEVSNVEVTAFTVTGGNVVFTTAPASGTSNIKIFRETTRTSALVDYVGGAALTEADLDLSVQQQLYLAQEALDAAADALTYAVDIQTSAGDLPTPSAQENYMLVVNDSDAWVMGAPATIKTALGIDTSLLLTTANNLSDVASAATSRTNLGLGTAAVLDTGTAEGEVVVHSADSAGDTLGELSILDEADLTQIPQLIILRYAPASGTDGGAVVADTWETRPLDGAALVDEPSAMTVGTNQFQLATGDYWCEYSVVANECGEFNSRLRDVTGTSTLVNGTTVTATGSGSMSSAISQGAGKFTVSVAANFIELQTYANAAQATHGMGEAATTGEVEVYAIIKLWKVA